MGTQARSFKSLKYWMSSFLEEGQGDGVPMLVFGNKLDLAKGSARKVQKAKVGTWAKANTTGKRYFELSAKTFSGLDKAFLAVGKLALEYQQSIAHEAEGVGSALGTVSLKNDDEAGWLESVGCSGASCGGYGSGWLGGEAAKPDAKSKKNKRKKKKKKKKKNDLDLIQDDDSEEDGGSIDMT